MAGVTVGRLRRDIFPPSSYHKHNEMRLWSQGPSAPARWVKAKKELDASRLTWHDASEMMPPTSKPICHWCFCFSKPEVEPGSKFRAQGSGDATHAGDPV